MAAMDETECTTSTREWAMLIITILSMNVSWWICDIPLLWTHGFRRYLSSVTWQCYRLYTPSCAALYAQMHARAPEEAPYIYYVGPYFDDPSPKETRVADPLLSAGGGIGIDALSPPESPIKTLSRFQISKSLVLDSLTIIATGLTVHQAIILPEDSPTSGIGVSIWAYPTLPVALLGIWQLVCGTWIRWSRKYTLWLGMLLVIGIGAAVIAPVAALSPAREKKLWILAIIAYVIMALPVLAIISGPGVLIALALGFLIRVGGVGIGSLSDMAYFPFCELRNKAFGATYITIGVIGALLAFVVSDAPPPLLSTAVKRWAENIDKAINALWS
ncbi:uncharacterized protein DNG_09079 [Cephalotrichum gorgonifer]|uniref:Uncharacterized protein n=1 Tax=Cephalotrichum gorgonifer TaxID=2041049 RepID=A0AAE8SYY8_9PEZI|nr:uncharacterized protein DNG_09079 [Cephalotrichum gorgonifer]